MKRQTHEEYADSLAAESDARDRDADATPTPGRIGSGVRAKVSRTNLDVPASRLVGRHGELEALRGLLNRERLVTLLGAPGIGKTRLARECALRALDDFIRDGGVWFVDLTEVMSLDGICSAVGRALEISVASGGDEAVQQLGAALAARGRVLLVLDNAEQVSQKVALVLESWSRAARDSRWLVTSRARLGTPGEVLFELGPLSLPIAGVQAELSDAVRLFVERARAVRFEYALTEEDRPTVARLVRELDGNALAIELAAARVRVLTPAQMLAQLGQRFELLTGVSRRAHARHLSLRTAIDASWNLLDGWERDALAQCSVFAGGFDVEAAARVLNLSAHRDVAPGVVDVLEALRDKSLLYGYMPSERRGEMRFSMYLSVRQYAWEKLGESGGLRGAIHRHARHYVLKGGQWRARIDGPDGLEARSSLALEMENLLVVHRRSLETRLETRGATPPNREEVTQALDAALALDALLGRAGPNTLRFTLLDQALAAGAGSVDGHADGALRARAHEARADAHRMLGRPGDAREDYFESARLAGEAADRAGQGRAESGLGVLSIWQGKLADARTHFEVAMTLFTEIGDRTSAGRALGWLGNVHLYEGRPELAWSVLEQAITVHRSAGDRRFEGMNVASLAVIAHDGGRLAEAKSLYDRALAIHREVGDKRLEAEVLGFLGVIAHEEGRVDDARELYTRALQMHGEVGNRRAEGAILGYLAGFLTEVGELEEARLSFARSLLILRECHDRSTEGLVLGGLASLEAIEGCVESSRAALHRATECLRGEGASENVAPQRGHEGPTRFAAAVELYRGHLELALAREALTSGEDARAAMYAESVRQRLGDAAEPSSSRGEVARGFSRSADVRLASLGLRRALEAYDRGEHRARAPAGPAGPADSVPPSAQLDLPADALLICAKGRWFRAPHGENVAIGRWHALQNLVVKLAERREIAPGDTLTVDELIAAGWPGERILPKAGATRVYTALSTLRRLGLRDVLVRRDGGYLLNPSVPLLRVSTRR